ncbi:MAG: hypothetical protein Q9204_001766 [Flavoplaca sp. TL-2023a]
MASSWLMKWVLLIIAAAEVYSLTDFCNATIDSNNLCISQYNQLNSSCWQRLDLDGFLAAWHEVYDIPCATPNTTDCCAGDESWSTCFLRLGYSRGLDCSKLQNDACPALTALSVRQDIPLCAQARYSYVGHSIIGWSTVKVKQTEDTDRALTVLYSFFLNWYDSLQAAYTEAESTILEIVQLIDKVQATNMAIQTFLAILSIGLSMVITIPDFSKVDDGAYRVASIVNEAIRQYPTVGRVLFPAGGTLESQQYQVAKLSSILRDQKINISDNIEAGLTLVMSDPFAFKAFTSSGAFTVDFGKFPSLNGIKKQLLLALQTYLVSVALSGNGWDVALIPMTDPRGITNGSTSIPYWAEENCSLCSSWTDLKCPDYDINGQCNRWWYSASQNTMYTLGHGELKDPSEILGTIFTKGWTTPQLLFENAAACSVLNWLNTNKLEPIDLRIDGARIITDTPMGAVVADNTSIVPMSNGISLFRPAVIVGQEKAPYEVEQWETVIDFVIELQLGNSPGSLPVLFKAGLRDLIPENPTLEHLSHPPETFYNLSGVGMDFSCISQLNVSVISSWYHVYHGLIV